MAEENGNHKIMSKEPSNLPANLQVAFEEPDDDDDDQNTSGNIDDVISKLGGCGFFQVVVFFYVYCAKIVASMSMIVMIFGSYNPGWQCLDLDNSTDFDLSSNNLTRSSEESFISKSGNLSNSSSSYPSLNTTTTPDDEMCRLFERCANVQFTPGVSTIVTEWGLICDRSWISSLIISIQMLGVLVGAFLSGYLGDKLGRKRSICGFTLYNIVVNIVAIFSVSWQMFAVMRFLIGVAIPFMMYVPVVLSVEFVPVKWRNAVICSPMWTIGCILFTLIAMVTEDWRYIHGAIAATSLIVLLPCYWVPESLRWLVINGKAKDAKAMVKIMARVNGKNGQEIEESNQIISRNISNQHKTHNLSSLQLLRKGYRYSTIVTGIAVLSYSIIYYAISFSIKSMHGNFYTNAFIMFSSELPAIVVSSTLPNYAGRKVSIIIFILCTTVSLFLIVGLDLSASGNVKDVGTFVCAVVARMMVDPAWDITLTFIGEVFPTVLRSTAMAYSNWISRIGGILAPFFISDNPDTYFINYLIMAIIALICCSLLIFLPETKGQPLRDTWEVKVVAKPEDSLMNGTDDSHFGDAKNEKKETAANAV